MMLRRKADDTLRTRKAVRGPGVTQRPDLEAHVLLSLGMLPDSFLPQESYLFILRLELLGHSDLVKTQSESVLHAPVFPPLALCFPNSIKNEHFVLVCHPAR